MAAPATVDEFLDLVRKSGVADEKRLDAYLAKARANMPADPPKAAGLLVHHGILTTFQAENILAGKWRRFSIGKYKVLEKLGSGGFAQVYLCEHKLMRRRVAVKVLPVAKTKDTSALERFYREARAAAALDHPNIVHAYDIDQDEDLHFLVMEYVDGANLQEIVQRSGPLNVDRACHYIRESALALQHAHENGLVHRDVKPGNILVDRSGVVKILDMGLALLFFEEDDQLTKKHDDGTLGTADYLSPEQAMDSHDVDIRTDIYSLGVTFYFLLTGRPPFEGVPMAQKLLAHQMKQPKPIADYRKDVPAGVLAVLDKMMAKRVENRYTVPGEVADALLPFTPSEIAAPTEAEVPRLSPAASGQMPATSDDINVGTPRTPLAPGSAKPKSGGSAAPRPSSAPPPRPKSSPVAPAPNPVAVQTNEAAWEQFSTDTDNPTAKDDTAPQAKTSPARAPKTPIASRHNPIVVTALILAFIVVPLIVVPLIFFAIWWLSPPPPTHNKGAPPKLVVSRDPARKAHPTIQLALRHAETGSVIELSDESYSENVVLDPANMRTGVTLQAAAGKEIVWRSARKDPGEPILKIRHGVDFKFKGHGIILDGALEKNRQVNDLIVISSDCSGMAIDDVQFRSFARSAVFIINGGGSPNQPIKLRRLITDSNDKNRAAIYFDANPQVLPPINDHIEIEDTEFRGSDPAKAIQVKDNAVLGKNVRWPGR